MARDAEQRRDAILTAVAGALPPTEGAFARRFYRAVAPIDLEALGVEELARGAASIYAFAQSRSPGRPKLRLFRPAAGEGWAARRSVLEVVNDDMPFLVDSIGIVLQRHGVSIDLNVHPVVKVARDVEGRWLALEGDGAKSESIMQIRLSGARDPATWSKIEAELASALEDVRAAVEDWRKILDRLTDASITAASGTASEKMEIGVFLEWLRDHFVFLGARDYRFEGEGADRRMAVVERSGLGVLRDPAVPVFSGARALGTLPPAVRKFLEEPSPIMIAKSDALATVHRSAAMDVIGVRAVAADGRVIMEHRFVGLFTATAYSEPASTIPLLRRRLAGLRSRAGLDPAGHDGKALQAILESYPRDELFQTGDDELFEIVSGILELQDRQRVAVFARRDGLQRFVSCLVYLPRERYDARMRRICHRLLAEAYAGTVENSFVQVGDAPLARLHVIVRTTVGEIPDVDLGPISAAIAAASTGWTEHFLDHAESSGGDAGLERAQPFADSFPAGYRDAFDPKEAFSHLDLLEQATANPAAPALRLQAGAIEGRLRLALVNPATPVPLSDALPLLENLGVRVMTETPHRIRLRDGASLYLQDFELETVGPVVDASTRAPLVEAGFQAVWRGHAENDPLNRLILANGLDWRRIALFRAYAKYLKQVGLPYSLSYFAETLARQQPIAAQLLALFDLLHDPANSDQLDVRTQAGGVSVAIEHALDAVTAADEDRILRRMLNLILCTLRTNFFDGGSVISLKLDSQHIIDLPKPRPMVEIWVYSPEVEGVHLRGGPAARGGIRWSDRREDFRTEVLGLVKAQTVKNAVIVPVGSKGGFVPKGETPSDPAARQAQGIAAYKTFIGSLLRITDTRDGAKVSPAPGIVRRDGDDPYLVVAADKGTATFSDIANGLSADAGFWLSDAFASGGSQGYDHKALGITARGAWVSVERHFREIGVDPKRDAIVTIGVGDMSGDVFGNGMLHGPNLLLVAAFDHRHIFLDPNPDGAKSLAERQRLFALPRSSWDDYDRSILSPGGQIAPRSAKLIVLSPEIRQRLGLTQEKIAPTELIRLLLAAEVDLLWFGGIGTYVKATDESHADAGDRANDALRLDGRDLRAKVIGEGANLGMTQRGRLEFAASGGRLNTDAIDNSAGVDMSDHEVNIKILLGDPVGSGALSMPDRNVLLASMANDVSDHVLEDNRRQTRAISVAERLGPDLIPDAQALLRRLELEAGLDRGLEFLPTDAALTARQAARQGLWRPELAVLLAYAKIWLKRALANAPLLDAHDLESDLKAYFPPQIQARYGQEILRHGLRRPIVGTLLTNQIVDRGGMTLVDRLMRETGASVERVAGAFLVARDLFALRDLWRDLDAEDAALGGESLALHQAAAEALATGMRWLLSRFDAVDLGPVKSDLEDQVHVLVALMPSLAHDGEEGAPLRARLRLLGKTAECLDVLALAQEVGVSIQAAAELWFLVSQRFALDRLVALAQGLPQADPSTVAAVAGLIADLRDHQRAITAAALRAGGVEPWIDARKARTDAVDATIADVVSGPTPYFARLALAERGLRLLVA
ncbi:MAG: NAD-glutamate dehydrogenase [Elsteraceae bacterium]